MDVPRPESAPSWPRKIIRGTALLLLLLLIGVGVWSFFIEPNRLVIHEEAIQIDNWPKELSGLRIAVISDIHTGAPFVNDNKLREIVARTNQLNPDLVVLLGDYMSPNSWHSHRVEPEVTAVRLKDLRAPLGVYSVMGNHDWWYNGNKVRSAFEQNGIVVLENETAEIKWRNSSFWVVGLADLWTRPQRIQETLNKVPAGSTIIAITHNPDIFPVFPGTCSYCWQVIHTAARLTFPLLADRLNRRILANAMRPVTYWKTVIIYL
jgi:predicted MPP superfamily phosphohydrolase